MRIIISPAKKMNRDDGLPWRELPCFLSQTEELFRKMKEMDEQALQKLWKCNDSIAQQNVLRLEHMDLRRNLTPAILAYEGIQYQYMAPGIFSDEEFAYIQEHLRILSGFYGILRPFDGVTPYRLEMQAKLSVGQAKDLYAFWGDRIAQALFAESDCVVNLASKEYSVCVSRYLTPRIRWINCVFGEEKDGKIIEKGTMCKMARGEMVRYMAQERIQDPEQLRKFEGRNHRYAPEYSGENTLVFLQKKASRLTDWEE